MDVLLNEHEQQIQQALAQFLEEQCPPSLVRQAEADGQKISPSLWRQLTQLGWTGLCIPPDCGGQGLHLSHLGLLFEELGRVLAPIPAHANMVAAMVLARYGSVAQQAVLREVVAGQSVLAFALQERDGRWDESAIQMSGRWQEGDVLLNGMKHFVDGWSCASHGLISFNLDGHLSLALVETGTSGIRAESLSALAKDDQVRVGFEDVRIKAESLLPRSDAALPFLMDLASVLMASQMQGAARRAMEMAVAYVNQRQAFGQPIGAFQAIQHMAADMLNAVDGVQLLAREALWRLGEGLPSRIEVAQAKAFASEQCLMVCRCAQQMHGGIGFMRDFDLHLWYRRVASWALRAGSSHEHRRRIASALLDGVGPIRIGDEFF